MNISDNLSSQSVSDVNLSRHTTVGPDDTVAATVAGMADQGFATACVVDDGMLKGLFTQRDYTLGVAGRSDVWASPISTQMVESPLITLGPDDTLADGLHLMNTWWISSVPIVDDGRLVGNLSYYTLMETITGLLSSRVGISGDEATMHDGLSFVDFTGINTTPPVLVAPDDSAQTAVHHVRARGIPMVLVADEHHNLVGKVSEFDLLTKAGCTVADLRALSMAEVMDTAPPSIPARTSVADAMALLVANESSSVPLVGESGRPVGMASFHDITGYIESTLATLD